MNDKLEDLNPYRGTDLWRLRRGLVLLDRLRQYALADDGDLEWILPPDILPDILPGVTQAWGLPVRRAEGLSGLYLAHRIDDPDREAK